MCFFSCTFVSALKNNNSDILLLPYKFGWTYYNVTPPWYSSMAQAEALPILIEAYNLTGSQNYLDTANGILNSFFLDVKDGGVTYKTNDSGWWYELYAAKDAKHPKVLNGMMWTLLALHGYYENTHDTRAKFLFDQGIISLKKNLHIYDSNGSSYYDALRTPANYDYHNTHIELLKKLFAINADKVFENYYTKWSKINMTSLSHSKSFDFQLDAHYIPFVNYGSMNGTFVGIQRNPLTVDHIARDYYHKYDEFHDPFFKNAFLNNVNWLVENVIKANITDKNK